MKTKLYSLALILLWVMLIVLSPNVGFAQMTKTADNHAKEIITDQLAPSKVVGNQRIESRTGIVRAVYSPNYSVTESEPEIMARQYLDVFASKLLLKQHSNDLEHKRTIETPGGFKVQFKQMAAGYPVYGSDIRVSINRDNKVVFVTNSYKPIGDLQTSINISSEEAVLTSRNHIGITGKLSFEKVETVVYTASMTKSVVAHKVNLEPAEDHFGDWEIIVDASNGSILRAEDKACYHYPDGEQVNGSGWVFDPDPVTNAKTTYGGSQFSDNGDVDTDSLTAQLKVVTLEDILFDGSMYRLEGPYAVIADFELPLTGLYEQTSSDFHYSRSDEEFEAVNVYFHLDKSMRYINETLGFDIMPYQYSGGIKFDPHGLNGAVNAHYTGSGRIAFGSPQNDVDLGEDPAIILHELGHGLHDWITNGGLSQVDGLSEGLGDYWAQSYTRSLGNFEPGDLEYDYFGVWGGMPGFGAPSLRVTNFDGHYPEQKDLEIHAAGQMWASSLMSIYDLIGREATDMDCWEGISMLNGSSSQVDAAFAFIQADIDLYNGVHLEQIVDVFYARGYISGPVVPLFTADQTNGEGPREVTFADESLALVNPITSWEWDFNNDGEIDSYNQNPTYTFSEIGAYSISLTVSDGEISETILKENYITVNGGFFVYETSKNMQDHSGAFIRDFLEAQGYDVIYSNYFPSTLEGFDAAFLSFGNAGESLQIGTPLSHENTIPIQDYLENGGALYAEGAPFFGMVDYFAYPNKDDFFDLFGVESMSFEQAINPMTKLNGTTGTFCEGMEFVNSEQYNSWYIDRVEPISGAFIPFVDETVGNVSILNEGDFDQKTFYLAYALAELPDKNTHSSKYNFMVQLMDFFGYPQETGYVVANFKSDRTNGKPDLEIKFSDWSLVDEGYEITGWEWDFDEDGEIDSYEQNPTWTFSDGGIFDITLIVSNEAGSDTLTKIDYISVRSGILVYEGQENVNGYSGTFIRDYLEDSWYDEVTYTNVFPNSLSGYDDVFLSFGNGGNLGTPLTSVMADIIYSYGLEGGHIYLEGGDAITSGEIMWLIFGISDAETGEQNTITELNGQDGSLAEGLLFNSTSQRSLKSIDTYSTMSNMSGVKIAFEESDYGPVAVQFDGTEMLGQKTFCMSYALADLENVGRSNTRENLLERILNFFDVVADVDEVAVATRDQIKVYPNPASNELTISGLPVNTDIYLSDLTGNLLMTLKSGLSNTKLNISELPKGLYLLRTALGTQKIVKM